MKERVLKTLFLLLVLVICPQPTYGDPLKLNTSDTHTVDGSTEFIFENTSEILQQLSITPSLDFVFLNYTGGSISISPWTDSGPFGTVQTVTGNGTYTLDYSGIQPSAQLIGILVNNVSNIATFNLLIKPSAISTLSSSGGTNSITGVTSNPPKKVNGLLVLNLDLPDSLTEMILIPNENLRCANRPCGINPGVFNDVLIEDITNLLNNNLDKLSSIETTSTKDLDFDVSLLIPAKNKAKSKSSFKKEVKNKTNKNKINLTAIYPINLKGIETNSVDITEIRLRLGWRFDTKGIALTQMSFPDRPSDVQLTYFDQCINPTFVHFPENSTLLNTFCGLDFKSTKIKPKEIISTIGSSKPSEEPFKFPFPIPDEILKPDRIIDINIPVKEIIGSPVLRGHIDINDVEISPDGITWIAIPIPESITQKITSEFKSNKIKCGTPVACNSSCLNEGVCCEADSDGYAIKTCKQSLNATIRVCLCLE